VRIDPKRGGKRYGRSGALSWLSAAVAVLCAAPALAQSGEHVSMDGKRNLINRDVGDERWAITQNLDDGTLTGNVFFSDGSPPAFIHCDPTAVVDNPNPALSTYSYDCYGTDTCTPQSCPQWAFISSVTVNGSFFMPPPPAPSPSPTPTATATPKPSATPTAKPTATSTAKPSATPAPTSTPKPATPTPTPKPSPTPTPTPKPAALVVTPDKASLSVGDKFLFVVTGGVPPYSLHVTIGGSTDPTMVMASGDPFEFTAEASGTSTVIVVDSTAVLKTVAVTVK
jgi:hypothetical protein